MREFAVARLAEQGRDAAKAVPTLTALLQNSKEESLVKLATSLIGGLRLAGGTEHGGSEQMAVDVLGQ